MSNEPTPRTDYAKIAWEYHKHYGYHDSLAEHDPLPWPEFAAQLERELTEVTKQRDEAREQRDRLAEALERLEKTAGLPALRDDRARIRARKALQYLTQNEL
jgi:hypothetical protein